MRSEANQIWSGGSQVKPPPAPWIATDELHALPGQTMSAANATKVPIRRGPTPIR